MDRHLRDYRVWLAIAGFLFAVLVTNPLSNHIYDWRRVWPWMVVALLISVGLAAGLYWSHQRGVRVAENTRRFRQDRQREEEPPPDIRPVHADRQVETREFGFSDAAAWGSL